MEIIIRPDPSSEFIIPSDLPVGITFHKQRLRYASADTSSLPDTLWIMNVAANVGGLD